MSIRPMKRCTECNNLSPAGWSEKSFHVCPACRQKQEQYQLAQQAMDVINSQAIPHAEQRVLARRARTQQARQEQALRADPTRRSLRNQGDDLDPLNPLSLTSPMNPVYHADWDNSSHRNAASSCDDSSTRHHSSHDDGGSYSSGGYDSGSSDSGSSGGGCD